MWTVPKSRIVLVSFYRGHFLGTEGSMFLCLLLLLFLSQEINILLVLGNSFGFADLKKITVCDYIPQYHLPSLV